MKTDNVYITQLVYSKEATLNGDIWDYYFGQGVHLNVKYKPIKYIIVKKQERLGKDSIGIDLRTNKKYSFELPFNKGKLYLTPSKMLSFELCYPDAPRNLPKKKILEMGSAVIDEINKIESVENKK